MKSTGIIKQVCIDHGMGGEDFFGRSRDPHLVKARMDAAIRLKEAGFMIGQIARFMKRDHSTIRYYLYPQSRAVRTARKSKARAAHAALRVLAPDVRSVVVEFAEAESTKPEIIIAQWVGERAEHEARAKREAA